MFPSFYDQNMTLLRRLFPELAEELEKAEEELSAEELKIETAASGAPTLVIRGLYVHSQRDPKREAEKLAEAAAAGDDAHTEDAAPILVLGFGLGYAASALAAKFPERLIIVVEKRPLLINKTLEARDIRPLLSHKRLVFVIGGGGEGVTGALSLFESPSSSPPAVIKNRALTSIDAEWYNAVEEKIRSWNSRSGVNRATQKRFGKLWIRNLSRNLELIRDIPGISRLEGILSEADIPVFLAAAGPTLDSVAPALAEIHQRCVIVAVDTSLRFLLAHGIDPDFVVSVDPQYWNFRHLDRAPAPKTHLIAESAVYPACLRHCFGGIFLCGSFFPLGRFIETKVDPKGDLGAGGSVATSAWDFARLLGSRNIWIAGLDLSFPELKTHFCGAAFEEKSHADSGRFSPAETWNFRALRDGQPFRAKRQGGGTVLTDKRLSLYAAWFESRFGQFSKITNHCLSAEGLALNGLVNSSMEELLSLGERRGEIDKLLKEVFESVKSDFYSKEASLRRAETYKNAGEILLRGLEEIKNLAHLAAECAGKSVSRNRQGRLDDRGRESILKKLDSANKSIVGSAVKEIAGFLFPETEGWEEEIAAKESDAFNRHMEFSSRFYRALSEAASYNLEKLQFGKTTIWRN